MYYKQAKKNLLAHLRQNGCPTLFFTLSSEEFEWKELLKEIIETVYRKNVSGSSEKYKLISENYVQTTLHFQKRIEKLFPLMQNEDFFTNENGQKYHLANYFYRIEFQARGAPHLQSLLWLKDSKGNDAPSFWNEEDAKTEKDEELKSNDPNPSHLKELKSKIETFADFFISTSPENIRCKNHKTSVEEGDQICEECKLMKEKCKKFQTHNHSFTCKKRSKLITINADEGHGKFDGQKNGQELREIPLCRFNFPKYPMEKTKLILSMSKELSKEEISKRTKDLKRINKFLIKQTLENEDILFKMSFLEFM